MENRLCLNKRPEYELPDEVLIGLYNVYHCKDSIVPKFEPDVCINTWGKNIGEAEKASTSRQLWIKTDNKNLIDFIKNFSFDKYCLSTSAKYINAWKFKKIILEEFYNKRA